MINKTNPMICVRINPLQAFLYNLDGKLCGNIKNFYDLRRQMISIEIMRQYIRINIY